MLTVVAHVAFWCPAENIPSQEKSSTWWELESPTHTSTLIVSLHICMSPDDRWSLLDRFLIIVRIVLFTPRIEAIKPQVHSSPHLHVLRFLSLNLSTVIDREEPASFQCSYKNNSLWIMRFITKQRVKTHLWLHLCYFKSKMQLSWSVAPLQFV